MAAATVSAVVGLGIDLVQVAHLERALARTPRLADRLFTAGERDACRRADGSPRIASLAARFAAKEAVAKALGTGIRGFGFRDVEVVTDELGRPGVVLHGGAAEVALQRRIGEVLIALTHAAGVAVAIAQAIGQGAER
jgi:holo-[acyl-carrier protein] synthase